MFILLLIDNELDKFKGFCFISFSLMLGNLVEFKLSILLILFSLFNLIILLQFILLSLFIAFILSSLLFIFSFSISL
jgi:hypothetical protein